MKNRIFLALVSLLFAITLYAQYVPNADTDSNTGNQTNPITDATTSYYSNLPKFYLGFGTGFNSYTGLLGISGNLRIKEKIFAQGGLGIGAWGYKSSLGIRIDSEYEKGWSYGIGFSSNSGLNDFKTDLEVRTGETKEVTMDLLRAYTLNLKAGYNFKVGDKSNFYIEFGPALALQSKPWRITDGSVLSDTSVKVLELISPGGFTVGTGFMFGL